MTRHIKHIHFNYNHFINMLDIYLIFMSLYNTYWSIFSFQSPLRFHI